MITVGLILKKDNKQFITHNGLKCEICEDIIYSRAINDYRSCSCGEISIDGGFDYTRASFKKHQGIGVRLILNGVSRKDLYEDWNTGRDNYGIYNKKIDLEQNLDKNNKK